MRRTLAVVAACALSFVLTGCDRPWPDVYRCPNAPSVNQPNYGRPDVTNTGVPPGTTLAESFGDVTVTIDGATIANRIIHGHVHVVADNVTIRNTLVIAGAYYPILNDSASRCLLVVDSEIDGQAGCENNISFEHYTALRVDVHGCSDGMKVGDETRVEDSYIHDLHHGEGDHNDGIQSTGGKNIFIVGNFVENTNSQNSAIILGEEDSPQGPTYVVGNWLGGGGYVIYAGYNSDQSVNPNIVVWRNRFLRTFPDGGYYGLLAAAAQAHVLWQENVWDDTGLEATP